MLLSWCCPFQTPNRFGGQTVSFSIPLWFLRHYTNEHLPSKRLGTQITSTSEIKNYKRSSVYSIVIPLHKNKTFHRSGQWQIISITSFYYVQSNKLVRGPLCVRSALLFIGRVNVGSRALLDPKLLCHSLIPGGGNLLVQMIFAMYYYTNFFTSWWCTQSQLPLTKNRGDSTAYRTCTLYSTVLPLFIVHGMSSWVSLACWCAHCTARTGAVNNLSYPPLCWPYTYITSLSDITYRMFTTQKNLCLF